jgi:hypothetical protein
VSWHLHNHYSRDDADKRFEINIFSAIWRKIQTCSLNSWDKRYYVARDVVRAMRRYGTRGTKCSVCRKPYWKWEWLNGVQRNQGTACSGRCIAREWKILEEEKECRRKERKQIKELKSILYKAKIYLNNPSQEALRSLKEAYKTVETSKN